MPVSLVVDLKTGLTSALTVYHHDREGHLPNYTENTEILVGNEIVHTILFGTFQKL